jgi:hypothetical protein
MQRCYEAHERAADNKICLVMFYQWLFVQYPGNYCALCSYSEYTVSSISYNAGDLAILSLYCVG